MKLKPVELRRRMSEKGLTVKNLASSACLQPETIYANLRDAHRRVRWDTIWLLSQALGCKPDDIAWIREYVRVEEEIEREVEIMNRAEPKCRRGPVSGWTRGKIRTLLEKGACLDWNDRIGKESGLEIEQ